MPAVAAAKVVLSAPSLSQAVLVLDDSAAVAAVAAARLFLLAQVTLF